jgi:hypothetical protein
MVTIENEATGVGILIVADQENFLVNAKRPDKRSYEGKKDKR